MQLARWGDEVELRTVAVLFTDLVDSTAISSRLTPSEGDRLLQTHFDLLRRAISAAGGTEVKSLGDGLMATFTTASVALLCAVSIQQAIDRHNRRAKEPLSIRIGISFGEVSVEDDDYFGDVVVQAARLCSVAQGGQILATEVVRAVVGRHANYVLSPVGDLELKGLPDKVPTIEVRWEPDNLSDRAVLPPTLVRAAADAVFPFVGRDAELSVLEAAQKRSAADLELRLILLSGEPGMGKTSLCARAARSFHESGAHVFYGSCEEGLGAPYKPWVEVLSQLIDRSEEPLIEGLSPAHSDALRSLLPALRDSRSAASEGAATDQLLLLDAIASILETASQDDSLVVALDDLHWSDAATLQVLRHLVSGSKPMRVVIVATFRDTDVTSTHPLTGLLAALRREPRCERVRLDGLANADVVELLETTAGQKMDDENIQVVHAVRAETGGNPYFVTELLRNLAEQGAIAPDDSGTFRVVGGLEALALPESVREVIEVRVARLGEDAVRVLSCAAVQGREFDLEMLAQIAEIDEDALIDLLDRSAAAAIVTETDSASVYRFRHTLIQQTLYQGLSAIRRQRLHRGIAAALERAGTDSSRAPSLARHLLAATEPAEIDKAIRYARLAGDAALAALAPDDAAESYERAIETLEGLPNADAHLRCELLIALGESRLRAGSRDSDEPLHEAGRIAIELQDAELIVRTALTRLSSWRQVMPADPQRLVVIEAALAATSPASLDDKARLLAALAEETDVNRTQDRRRLADEAFAAAQQDVNPKTFVDVVVATFHIRSVPDTIDERRQSMARVLALVDGARDPILRSQALNWQSVNAGQSGDLSSLDRCISELTGLADRYALPYVRLNLLCAQNGRAVMLSDLEACETIAGEIFKLSTEFPENAIPAYGGALFEMRRQQGRLEEIVESILERAVRDDVVTFAFRAALVYALCETGRLDEARSALEPDLADGFETYMHDGLGATDLEMLADVVAELRDEEAAVTLYERMVPWQTGYAYNGVQFHGAYARPLGRLAHLLGRTEDAASHFEQALALNGAIPAAYHVALTQVDYATLLNESGVSDDQERALALARDSLDMSKARGFAGIARKAEAIVG